jgi:predicted nucleotidyltransferase
MSLNYQIIQNIPYLPEIIDVIINIANPEKIILFGSYANGSATDKSDIDLLILKKNLQNETELSGDIYRAMLDRDIFISKDLVTMDYDSYYESIYEIGDICKTINTEGILIYESV